MFLTRKMLNLVLYEMKVIVSVNFQCGLGSHFTKDLGHSYEIDVGVEHLHRIIWYIAVEKWKNKIKQSNWLWVTGQKKKYKGFIAFLVRAITFQQQNNEVIMW